MSFTIVEYAQQKGLDLDPKDTKAMKMIAEHLRKLGYEPQRTRKGGKSSVVWVRGDRSQKRQALALQLQDLEKGA